MTEKLFQVIMVGQHYSLTYKGTPLNVTYAKRIDAERDAQGLNQKAIDKENESV